MHIVKKINVPWKWSPYISLIQYMYPVLYKISNDSKLFLYILNSMRLVWEEIDEATIDMDEVDKLFCKPPSEASQKASKTRAKSPAKQVSPIVPQVVKKGT